MKELLDRDEALASALWGKRGQTPLNVMLNDFNMQPSNEDKIDPAFFDVPVSYTHLTLPTKDSPATPTVWAPSTAGHVAAFDSPDSE